MNFFSRYPMMTPHVGRDYHLRTRPSVLLVGESHYLPDGATQHLTPAGWYGGDHKTMTLDDERDVVRDFAGLGVLRAGVVDDLEGILPDPMRLVAEVLGARVDQDT